MAESKESLENLAYIRTHVDNLERLVRFQISANPASKNSIRERFGQREGMAEVYLALAQGPLTQDELAEVVRRSVPTISRILKQLAEEGMVEKMQSLKNPKKMAYRWTDLEEMLKVSRIANEYLTENPGLRTSRVEATGTAEPNTASDVGDSEG
jgi:predicted transcriptional regulator